MRKFLSEHQRIINGLAILSLVAVASITGLRFVPAWFPHADVIGDLFFELSIVYLGAWFFNLLVIEIPRRRERVVAFNAISNRLELLVNCAAKVRQRLSESTGVAISEDDLKANHLALMEAAADVSTSDLGGLRSPAEWVTWQHNYMMNVFNGVDPLMLMHFDVGLHVAAENVLRADFFTVIDMLSDSGDTTASTLAHFLDRLQEKCDHLAEQLETAKQSL